LAKCGERPGFTGKVAGSIPVSSTKVSYKMLFFGEPALQIRSGPKLGLSSEAVAPARREAICGLTGGLCPRLEDAL